MSYKKGGVYGIKNAYKSKTLCTIKFESNLEISGIVENYITHNNKVIFIKLTGPSQISFKNKQISGHGADYHSHGYSTPLGNIIKYKKPLNKLNSKQLNELNIKKNKVIKLFFEKNIYVFGKIIKIIKKKSQIILITFKDCYVKNNEDTLFKPEWGQFDMIFGDNNTSVYNGPSDRKQYYKIINNPINERKYSIYNKSKKTSDSKLELYFKKLNKLKEKSCKKEEIKLLYNNFIKNKFNDWLFKYEILELLKDEEDLWIKKIYKDLEKKSLINNDTGRAIRRGLKLI